MQFEYTAAHCLDNRLAKAASLLSNPRRAAEVLAAAMPVFPTEFYTCDFCSMTPPEQTKSALSCVTCGRRVARECGCGLAFNESDDSSSICIWCWSSERGVAAERPLPAPCGVAFGRTALVVVLVEPVFDEQFWPFNDGMQLIDFTLKSLGAHGRVLLFTVRVPLSASLDAWRDAVRLVCRLYDPQTDLYPKRWRRSPQCSIALVVDTHSFADPHTGAMSLAFGKEVEQCASLPEWLKMIGDAMSTAAPASSEALRVAHVFVSACSLLQSGYGLTSDASELQRFADSHNVQLMVSDSSEAKPHQVAFLAQALECLVRRRRIESVASSIGVILPHHSIASRIAASSACVFSAIQTRPEPSDSEYEELAQLFATCADKAAVPAPAADFAWRARVRARRDTDWLLDELIRVWPFAKRRQLVDAARLVALCDAAAIVRRLDDVSGQHPTPIARALHQRGRVSNAANNVTLLRRLGSVDGLAAAAAGDDSFESMVCAGHLRAPTMAALEKFDCEHFARALPRLRANWSALVGAHAKRKLRSNTHN